MLSCDMWICSILYTSRTVDGDEISQSPRYIVQWYTIRADGITLFFLMERCQCNFVQKLRLGIF